MSYNIVPVNLAGLIVGNNGNVNLPTITDTVGYTLLLFNESGSGLSIQFLDSKDNHILPAGAWRKYELNPGEEAFTWTILYVLPGPPVTQLFGTLYRPGEKVPDLGVLGNSPIGGQSSTLLSTLSNEGNAINTEVIDIGTSGIAKLIDIFNDHFVWSVQQSGVAHQVLKGQTAGNPLQVGQAADIVEFLGKAFFDDFVNIEPASPPVLNGSTTGTLTIYQLTRGTIKISLLIYNNFRNGGASVQTLGFPVGYSNRALFICSDAPGFTLRVGSGGADITNHSVITTLAAGGGTATLATTIQNWSFGELRGAFDTIAQSSGNSSGHNALLLMIGQ